MCNSSMKRGDGLAGTFLNEAAITKLIRDIAGRVQIGHCEDIAQLQREVLPRCIRLLMALIERNDGPWRQRSPMSEEARDRDDRSPK